jgi:hypothetical protein
VTLGERVLEVTAAYPRLTEIGAEPYEPRGIFNSEMAAVIAMSLAEGIDLFVESGRSRGHSTLLLAKHLSTADIAIHSFDRDRNENALYSEKKLAGLPNLHLHYGDSRLLIPAFIAANRDRRIGLLIDGPKDRKAIALLSDCLIQTDAVKIAFVHDVAVIGQNEPMPGRMAMLEQFAAPFFTDDPAFVARFEKLDAPVFGTTDAESGHTKKPYEGLDPTKRSYGPTLGVLVPTDIDRQRARQRGWSTGWLQREFWAMKDRLRPRLFPKVATTD